MLATVAALFASIQTSIAQPHPLVTYAHAQLKENVMLNPSRAISSMNAQLGLADGRIDSKILFADAVQPGDVTTLYAIKLGEANPVKTVVYVLDMTSIPTMQAAVQEGIIKEMPGGQVQTTDWSIVTFLCIEAPGNFYTATSSSFTIMRPDQCEVPFVALTMMAMATDLDVATQQHTAAAEMMAQPANPPAPPPFLPGTVLPSGTPLPAALPSPFTDCVAALGPQPSTAGLQDPCDLLIANAFVCDWVNRCQMLRANLVALRKAKQAATQLGVGGGAAVGGIVASLLCPPCSVVVLIIAGCVGASVLVSTASSAVDQLEDSLDAAQEAAAFQQAIEKCWAGFAENFDRLCFPW